MMLYEFPKLVHHFSLERVGMQIDYQILDEKKALSQEMLKLCARSDRKLDVQPDGVGGFWINHIDYRGIQIDEMRLAIGTKQPRRDILVEPISNDKNYMKQQQESVM